MALLRYTLRDGRNKVSLNASWVEELYYGPVIVTNGYAEVPDNDDIAIFVLCNRGFEIVKERIEVEEPKLYDLVNEDDADQTEDDLDQVEEVEWELTRKSLEKMTVPELRENAGRFGLTEDHENYTRKADLIDAILAANEED